MKKLLFILLLALANNVFAQELFEIKVLDRTSRAPLAFCNVAIKGSTKGWVTNKDGKVAIYAKPNDVVLFSFIGFHRKLVPAKLLKEKSIVYLDRTSYNLNEVVIAAESDYLYDILGKCRRKMQGNKVVLTAKTYYSVETKANDTILEFLECYYNAYFENLQIDRLKFKQGRFGLAKVDGNYFVTMGTSKAIADINLLENKGYFPYVPTQLKRRKLKRNFNLKHLGTFDNYYKISFKAKNNEAFNGVILIDTSSFDILQLKLHVENTPKHPFVSLYPSSDDRLSKLSINLNYQFAQHDGNSRLELIDLQYSFDYLSDRSFAVPPKVILRDISAKSTFYFFDFGEPFILPYLDLNSETGDYFSIAAIPYNDVFWTMQENRMLLTEDQQKNLKTLMQNGDLVNYKKISIKEMGLFMDTTNHATIFEEHLHWKQHKRIRAHSIPHTNSEEAGRKYNANTFNFYIQILLDITDCKDSLHTRSSTTFNIRDSYYYYPKDSISDAFINIYFDICEIERRKMQHELDSTSYTLEQIDQLYYRTKNRIDSLCKVYVKEVDRGYNAQAFAKWNQYIIDELGIDNLAMCIQSWEANKVKEKEIEKNDKE